MDPIPDPSPAVSPQQTAGLLLAACETLRALELPHPAVEQIIEKTGASRSRAYEVKNVVLRALAGLTRPPGRPPNTTPPAPLSDAGALTREALRFVMDHPGCVHGGPERRHYADSFRRFVLRLHEKSSELGVDVIATAVGIPADTLRDWLRHPVDPPTAERGRQEAKAAPDAATSSLHIQTVLAAWKTWNGDFTGFCQHVQLHLRVPFGRSLVAGILEAHEARVPKRRPGRSPDEAALRKAFETFFPGAQWVGDGTPVAVTVEGERFVFNLELQVDASTAAITGASIRDAEDSAAVVESFHDGVATTGEPPLAELLDNRPSNFTPEVLEALGGTLLIPATLGRAQNKGHCEGAFGLFFQTLPALVLAAAARREVARQLLRLVVTTWGRTLNYRPRKTRGGKSRVELYAEKPTDEQVARARAALEERLRRQQQARETARARLDPVSRELLAAAFARLALVDPGGHLQDAIARYPLSAIVDGIAVFEGKRAAGSLPPGVDGRYLLGIVRNIHQQREAEHISEAMLSARLEAQDAILSPLAHRRKTLSLDAPHASALLARLIEEFVKSERYLDRLFWLDAAAEVIRTDAHKRVELYRFGARLIHAATGIRYAERLAAERFLADKVFPLDHAGNLTSQAPPFPNIPPPPARPPRI